MAEASASDSERGHCKWETRSIMKGTMEKKTERTRGGTKPWRKAVNSGFFSATGLSHVMPLTCESSSRFAREAMKETGMV